MTQKKYLRLTIDAIPNSIGLNIYVIIFYLREACHDIHVYIIVINLCAVLLYYIFNK